MEKTAVLHSPLSPDRIALEITLVLQLLNSLKTDSPLYRWIQYRGYRDFVDYLSSKDELPEGYEPFEPDERALHEWITGIGALQKSFLEELGKILSYLKKMNSKALEAICNFYCEYKKHLQFGNDAAAAIIGLAGVAAQLKAAGIDLTLFGGLPITTALGLLFKSGLLDKYCDCPK